MHVSRCGKLGTMNCPGCSASVETDQQFCRSCGTALLTDSPSRFRPQVVMLLTLLLTFIGIIIAIGGDMAGLRWLKFTGVFAALGGLFSMMAAAIIMDMRSPKRSALRNAQQPATLERADTTNKLLPVGENDFIPSVIEHTTERLETAKPRQTMVK